MDKKLNFGFRIYQILLYIVAGVLFFNAAANLLLNGLVPALVAFVFFLIVLGIAIYVSKVLRLTVRDQVLRSAVELGNEFQQYMNQWEYPYALFSAHLRLEWYNEAFRKVVKYENCKGKTLEELQIPWGAEKPDWDPLSKMITLGDRYYKAVMTQIRLRDQGSYQLDLKNYTEVYSLSLQDVTKEVLLEQENLDQQTVVSYIYIDNYDQTVSNMEENRRPLLEAMISRRLSDFSSAVDGILTKMENDRFIMVFPHKNLEKLFENKFNVLEEMKKLNIGNKFPVTLSIGVGVDKDMDEARQYARAAVDLAMGRGGDQAVVRQKDGQKFFGGMTTTTENNTRVRARLIAYALKELIMESDRVLLMGHANPDLDCFGAALGMYRAVFELKKPVHIVMSAEKHAAVEYLYGG